MVPPSILPPGFELFDLGPQRRHLRLEPHHAAVEALGLGCGRFHRYRPIVRRGLRNRLAAEEVHVARFTPSGLARQPRDERPGLALLQRLQHRLDLRDITEPRHATGA